MNISAKEVETTSPCDSLIVLCSCPNHESAEQIASALVEQRLAACVNIIPGVQSVYRWEGNIAKDEELLLVVKTAVDSYDDLQASIVDMHPYELPEVIAVSIERGLSGYLQWIQEQLS
ncbi:MAG: divalent-cation tolerance protein CutA [Gammaproteobacteria bacterium]